MKIQSTIHEIGRTRVFPIKISIFEERMLKDKAEKEKKSIAALIREGYLSRVQHIPTFSKCKH